MPTTKTIRVSESVYTAIQQKAGAGEIPDDVLRRVLGLEANVRGRKAIQRQQLVFDKTQNRLCVCYYSNRGYREKVQLFLLPSRKDDAFENWRVRESVKKFARKNKASEGQIKAIESWFSKHEYYLRKNSPESYPVKREAVGFVVKQQV